MTLSATTALLAASGTLFVAAAPSVTLTRAGHTPTIGKHWEYSLVVREGDKPVKARLTAQIVDPIGGVHAVEFGASTKDITNWPFDGSFHDYIIWPADSRGIPLTFRLTVRIGSAKKVVSYPVTPRS